jgi:cation:H+ antiporter
MSDATIGLTVVAIATSLPELATSVMAARRGQVDIAVGNVVGSNIFNILLVLGVTATIAPTPVPPGGARSLAAMLLLAVLLVPMSKTDNGAISRLEGAVLLALYVASIVLELMSA